MRLRKKKSSEPDHAEESFRGGCSMNNGQDPTRIDMKRAIEVLFTDSAKNEIQCRDRELPAG